MARPSKYTEELANEICQRLCAGESLLKICRDNHIPDRGLVHQWVLDNAEFRHKYTHAREVQAHVLADETIEISDICDETPEAAAVARLRIESRKWYASKVASKHYGQSVDVNHKGKVQLGISDILNEIQNHEPDELGGANDFGTEGGGGA